MQALRHIPLLISAKSESRLKTYAQQLAQILNNKEEKHNLYDVAYHLYKRCKLHTHRAMIYSSSSAHAAKELQAFAKGESSAVSYVTSQSSGTRGPVFVFSGNGSQWEGMGSQLLKHPVFLETIKKIDSIFIKYSDFSLESELLGQNGTKRYENTDVAQPALFAMQVGLVNLLAHEGVRPAAVVGHSVGEIAAAWACGALSLAQAVRVIFERSRLQQNTKGLGQMTAASLGACAMRKLLKQNHLKEQISLAGENSSTGCTLAGLATNLDQIEAILKEQNIRFIRLKLDYAFHSPYMDCIKSELLNILADLNPSAPKIPMYSVVDGGLITATTPLDANYWWLNIRQAVLFEPAINAMFADGYDVFVEVGPHPVLRSYIKQAAKDSHVNAHINVLGQRHNEILEQIQQRALEVLLVQAQPNMMPYFPTVGKLINL